ncbi:hypothetical protein, partial [Paraburkholderia sp.]|uniref:hypothetical protein n=1 Tax=Paraburkholderia sp. TaxID=1926495 RepID=UPI0039E31D75
MTHKPARRGGFFYVRFLACLLANPLPIDIERGRFVVAPYVANQELALLLTEPEQAAVAAQCVASCDDYLKKTLTARVYDVARET